MLHVLLLLALAKQLSRERPETLTPATDALALARRENNRLQQTLSLLQKTLELVNQDQDSSSLIELGKKIKYSNPEQGGEVKEDKQIKNVIPLCDTRYTSSMDTCTAQHSSCATPPPPNTFLEVRAILDRAKYLEPSRKGRPAGSGLEGLTAQELLDRLRHSHKQTGTELKDLETKIGATRKLANAASSTVPARRDSEVQRRRSRAPTKRVLILKLIPSNTSNTTSSAGSTTSSAGLASADVVDTTPKVTEKKRSHLNRSVPVPTPKAEAPRLNATNVKAWAEQRGFALTPKSKMAQLPLANASTVAVEPVKAVKKDPAPKVVKKDPAPKAVKKAPAPKAVKKAPAPKAVKKAPAPKAVKKAPAPEVVTEAVDSVETTKKDPAPKVVKKEPNRQAKSVLVQKRPQASTPKPEQSKPSARVNSTTAAPASKPSARVNSTTAAPAIATVAPLDIVDSRVEEQAEEKEEEEPEKTAEDLEKAIDKTEDNSRISTKDEEIEVIPHEVIIDEDDIDGSVQDADNEFEEAIDSKLDDPAEELARFALEEEEDHSEFETIQGPDGSGGMDDTLDLIRGSQDEEDNARANYEQRFGVAQLDKTETPQDESQDKSTALAAKAVMDFSRTSVADDEGQGIAEEYYTPPQKDMEQLTLSVDDASDELE